MTDRYQILEPLASGGRGDVFRGWDSSLGREVAIKRIRGRDAKADDLVREARILSSLQHPNIVTVYDVGVDSEGAYIVMELIKGETLDDLIVRGALTTKDFRSLVIQSLEGMIAAHAAGLIHLDLKPGNLMITWHASGTFQVKILDFGLAQGTQPATQTTDDQDGVLGSVHFMAPEQFERLPVDVRTDIYALGAIFYYALTQQYPFQGETSPQVMVSHLYHRFTPLLACRPDLPSNLCAWVERFMSRKPDDRPQSMAEALQSFRSLNHEPVAVAVAMADETVQAPKKKLLPAAQTGGQPRNRLSTTSLPKSATGSATRKTDSYTPPTPQPSRRPAGLPKWSYVTIPFLVILIGGFAVVRYIDHSRHAARQQRLLDLMSEERPQGSDLDVRLLFEFLEDPATSPGAAQALSKLEGGDYIEAMLTAHLDHAKSIAARVNLLKVIGLRGVRTAFGKVIVHVEDRNTEVRKAAWDALGMITAPTDLPLLIDRLGNVEPAERDFAEQALVSAIEASPDRSVAIKPAIGAYQSASGTEASRIILLSVLGRAGGPDGLKLLTTAMADKSVEVRRAALTALAQSPTHDPLPDLAARFSLETDPPSRVLILMAATEVISQPGPMPQHELFDCAKQLYEGSKNVREKDQALAAISRVTDQSTISFFDALAISEPNRKREAEAISKALQAKLSQVVAIGAGAKLAADKAEFQRAGAMSVMADILVNWMSEADWASWLVQMTDPGDYEVDVTQAHASDNLGSYEIDLAGQRLVTAVVKTKGSTDFQAFVAGKARVAKPGIYKLTLRPLEIPPNETLFRLRGLEIKRVP